MRNSRTVRAWFLGFAILLSLSAHTLPAEIAVVHSTLTEESTVNYPTYVEDFQRLTEWMDAHFAYDVITDVDVVDGKLSGYELIILPNNGVMVSLEAQAIREYARSGGKVLGFFSTSLRDMDLNIVGYQLADLFGVTWNQFVTDPSFDAIKIVADHPAMPDEPVLIPVGTKSTQDVTLQGGQALGVRATRDGVESDRPVVVGTDYGIFIANHAFAQVNLAMEGMRELLYSIIAYYAPGAVK